MQNVVVSYDGHTRFYAPKSCYPGGVSRGGIGYRLRVERRMYLSKESLSQHEIVASTVTGRSPRVNNDLQTTLAFACNDLLLHFMITGNSQLFQHPMDTGET